MKSPKLGSQGLEVSACVLTRGEDIVPIPGTKPCRYLEGNVAALGVTVSANEVARIDRAIPAGAAAGTRHPAAPMQAPSR
jgi:hypothetical protein